MTDLTSDSHINTKYLRSSEMESYCQNKLCIQLGCSMVRTSIHITLCLDQASDFLYIFFVTITYKSCIRAVSAIVVPWKIHQA